LGPLPRPPKSPLWSSFPSFQRVLFRSLPGSLSRLPSVLFGAPRGLLWGPHSLIPSSSHSSFPFPGAPWLPLGPLPGPPGTPFGAFFQSFHRAPFWSVPRPSCCLFPVPQVLSLWPDYFIPSSLPLSLFPFPAPPELPLGLFSKPPWCPLWDSILSFLKTLFRSLPGIPGALFGAPII
jgi:hypothetical protein